MRGARHGRAGDRHRGRSDPRPRGGHGRLSRHADARRLPQSATCSSPSPATSTCIREEHFQSMRDGAIVCNSGHFDVEIDMKTLRRLAQARSRQGRAPVRRRLPPAQRPLRSTSSPKGASSTSPPPRAIRPSVMDMSFATQALSAEWALEHEPQGRPRGQGAQRAEGRSRTRSPPLKLDSMGIKIDRLTSEQRDYLTSWSEGT